MKINVKIPNKINIGEIKTGTPPYTLPIASADTLGGIKVGNNLTIDEDGTLNAQAGGGTNCVGEEREMIYANLSTAYQEDITAWQRKTISLDTEISKLGSNLTLTNEGRIKIGSGISKISIQAGILASPQTKEGILDCRIYLVRDGKQTLINQTYTELVTLKYSVSTFNIVPIYDVQENDEIELVYTSNVAGTFKIFQTGTFLSVEKINERNVISGNEVDITEYVKKDEIYYKSGDKFGASFPITISGLITSSSKRIIITLPVPKRLDNITTITCTSYNAELRCNNGYVNSASGYKEYASDSEYSIVCSKAEKNMIEIYLNKSSAFTNIENNTLVVVRGYFNFDFS